MFVNPDGGGPVGITEQRNALERNGLGVNVAQFVPHGSVREAVMGLADRHANPGEIDRMRAIVRRGMEEGAWGLSAGPFYAPGSYADNTEYVELAKVATELGGAFQSHIRDESDYSIGVIASVEEVITVARDAKLPSVVTHIKALGPGGGYIFSPSHYILADVPIQNIFAMLEAVKDFGVYGKYPVN